MEPQNPNPNPNPNPNRNPILEEVINIGKQVEYRTIPGSSNILMDAQMEELRGQVR